jgi:hypothetical protein
MSVQAAIFLPSAFTTARPGEPDIRALAGCPFATTLIPSVPKSLSMPDEGSFPFTDYKQG